MGPDAPSLAASTIGCLRTEKTKGCLNRKTALAMTFKLILSAKRKWRKLNGSDQPAAIIDGVPFKDGIMQIERAA